MDEGFQVVFEKNENALTVRPGTRLDTVTAPQLEEAVKAELNDKAVTEVMMDLSSVNYVSSAGLRVLLIMEQEMEKRGGRMKLVHVCDTVRDILEMTGFLELVEMEQSE